ncbi:MAG TPA: peptidyl-prolyl cis-trans isomerase [Candidatus Hydrogenedentes bacterium]|nr:peptidyl-prolyl cis-trans isomerase [Candidatus Hydrogenedentota bacterium]
MRMCGFYLAVLVVVSCGALAQAPDLSKMDVVLKAVPDGPVAVVNGQPIPARVFRDLYMGEVIRWAATNQSRDVPDDDRLGIAIHSLRVLVEREVLYQEAQKRNISVSDADLQAKWKSEFEDLRKRVSKEGEAPLTEAQVLERANTDRNEALSELRKAMMVDLVRQALIKEKGVTVSDAEVSAWFNENRKSTSRPDMLHLKQIYFKADKTATPKQKDAARAKANTALERIKSGQSFEGIARDMSEGQYKDNGGEWPVMPSSEFPPFILNAVNTMKPNDISPVIESEVGFHILKLIEVIPGQEGSLEKAAPRIKEMLIAQKGARVVSEFCGATTGDPNKVRVYLDLEKQLQLRPDLVKKINVNPQGAAATQPGAPPKR